MTVRAPLVPGARERGNPAAVQAELFRMAMTGSWIGFAAVVVLEIIGLGLLHGALEVVVFIGWGVVLLFLRVVVPAICSWDEDPRPAARRARVLTRSQWLTGLVAGFAGSFLVAAVVALAVAPSPESALGGLKWTDETPAWSPDGREIVFASNRADPKGSTDALYLMDADGAHTRRLTIAGLDAREPSFSPDGRRIVYAANVLAGSGSFTELGQVQTISRRGRFLAAVSSGLAGDAGWPAWSPNGHLIAFSDCQCGGVDGGNTDLYVARPDGSGLRKVATDVYGWAFSWSPDGKEIAVGGADVSVISAGRRKPLHVGTGGLGAPVVTDVAWSPDGAAIAFVSGLPTLDGTGDIDRRALWVIDRKSGKQHRIWRLLDSRSVGSFDVSVTWLADPATLAVFAGKRTDLVTPSGRLRRSLVTPNWGQLAAGSGSPDGRELLVVDGPDSSDHSAIFRAAVSNAALRRLTQTGH